MPKKPVNKLTLSRAIQGVLLYKRATGKSHHTILDYQNAYNKLALYFPDDPPFASITRAQLLAFFVWLQDEYISIPGGVAPRAATHLAPKSIKNIHVALSVLWTWGVEEGYVKENLLRTIAPPPVEPPAIQPFTKDEIKALLKACDRSRAWKSRPTVNNRRPTADRDRAIILLLLDTGIRRSELCDITIADLNLTANSIRISGKGKGRDKKERYVYFGRRTARALFRYLTPRFADQADTDLLFVVGPPDDPRPLDPRVLYRLLRRLGDRAGVPHVHPHRFRHTFAITYLRNQGDPFTLRNLLGHADLTMVTRYLHIVQADCADAHRRASPVDNWRL